MNSNPRQKYAQHKANAKARGIDFDLTFDEWWEIWQPRFNQRGTAPGQYQMCRTQDEGPYSAVNVRIDTVEANRAEWSVTARRRIMRRDWGDSPDQAWVIERGRHHKDYFSMRIRAEKLAEAGLDDSDVF